MATQRTIAPKKLTRNFADGGAIGGDGLTDAQRAKINGARSSLGISDVSPAPQNPEPKPQAQQRPEAQGITTGIVGLLKGRAAAIDKAAGYANGGKPGGGLIVGPGTAKSDSIPAKVSETGENIKVSTEERILSKAQDTFLQSVAMNAGYESLDAMLEDGTGKPVGPVIRGGKRAAADGLPPDDDPFAYRGGIEFGGNGPVNGPDSTALGPSAGIAVAPGADDRSKAAIAAPPSLGGAPLARSEPLGTLTAPTNGLVMPDKPQAQRQAQGMSRLISELGVTAPGATGRDASGIITADSASASAGNPMTRSGGIAGGIDMAGVNGILARENKARGEMIDSMVKANGGNGIAILGGDGPTETDKINAERTARWRQDDLISLAQRGNQGAIAAALHANAQTESEAMRTAGATANEQTRGALLQRGQDLGLQRAAERNDVLTRGQDMRAGTAADRIASNETIAGARIAERSGPTLGQQRGNAEIDAARERIAGMDATEIKRKTANFTSTGRENPDFDPTLAKAVTLANRRKVGDDQHFDQREQPRQPSGNDGDTLMRFRADQGMRGHTTGKQTENGIEVFDAAGRLIGHYR